MKKLLTLLLAIWHSLTLGRTAKPVTIYLNGPASDNRLPGGTLEDLAYHLQVAARETLPLKVVSAVWYRRAYDLPRGLVRIVIEVNE